MSATQRCRREPCTTDADNTVVMAQDRVGCLVHIVLLLLERLLPSRR